MQIIFSDKIEETDKEFFTGKLREYNNRVSPYHLAIRQPEAVQSFSIIIRDEENNIAGGILAEMYWGWLYVDTLWIAEKWRGQGYGVQLMQQTETHARKHGCKQAYLTTYSFQARGLYEKLGWRVVGQLDDYPPGETYYWMRKDFTD